MKDSVARVFLKHFSFLIEEYNFEFLIKSRGIDKKYILRKGKFEIGFFNRIGHCNDGDSKSFFYYAINEVEKILNIED